MAVNTKLFDGMVVFAEVINNGSFSAAAETTGHSTSYISKEITKLEKRLAVRLLNRTTRTLGLTPEGKVFYKQAQQLIEDTAQTLNQLNQTELKPKGLLKISCPTSYGATYLQPILSEYLRLFPDVTLELDLNDRQVDIIQEGYDLAIRATNQLEDSSLICKKIKTYDAYTIASPNYLKKFGWPKHPLELTQHQCISYSNLKYPNKWQYKKTDGETIVVDVPQTILCNSSGFELSMVLDDHGICRLPEFCMPEQLKDGDVCILFDNYFNEKIDVYALYPSRKHLSPKIRSFIELLLKRIT